jgi:hypothetical protein
MSETLALVFKDVVDRLSLQATTYLPSLIAASIVILGALVVATIVRFVTYRIFKGAGIDRFLRRTGVAHLVAPSGRLRATRITAETAYLVIVTIGVLASLSAFGTDFSAEIIANFVLLVPRLIIAGAIILGGAWLSHHLARSMLVWAFNENLPHPRRIAACVRVMVLFTAIVVASDHLNFARSVFLTAFIIFVGGLVLAVSLAVGIGAAGSVRGLLKEKRNGKSDKEKEEEPSLWSHL